MAAVKPGNVRKKATKMGEKPLATPLVTAMYSYILHGFPNVAAPRLERIGRALLPRRFIQTDQALRCGRGQREDALRNQNPCHAEGIQKHGGQRRHGDLQNRVEHGGHRVALFLGALRNQLRVDAGERELIHRAKAGQQQGQRQIADIGKIKGHQPQPHSGQQGGV